MKTQKRLTWQNYFASFAILTVINILTCQIASAANSEAAAKSSYMQRPTTLSSIVNGMLDGQLIEKGNEIKSTPIGNSGLTDRVTLPPISRILEKTGIGNSGQYLNSPGESITQKYNNPNNPPLVTPNEIMYLAGGKVLNEVGTATKPFPFIAFPGQVLPMNWPASSYKPLLGILNGGPVSDKEDFLFEQLGAVKTADTLLNVPIQTVKARTIADMQGVLDTGEKVAQQSLTAGLAELTKPIPNPSSNNSNNPAMIKVNKMYFAFFLPLAILLMMPGASLSSMQFIMKNAGLLQAGNDNIFSFLQRPLIALFMMAACPLFVGVAIDVGNAMTAAVATNIDEQAILAWFESNTNKLSLSPQTGGVTAATAVGIATGTASTSAVVDTAMSASQALKGAIMNTSSALLSNAVQILTVFQIVLVAYLYVMGPIACAMWVYPESGIIFFRKALGSWLNGIICLVLWKFIWAVILLCVQSRLTWLKEMGGTAGDGDWESFMLVAFLTLLAIAPAACFSFNPGSYVDAVLAKAKQMSKGKGAASSLSSMGI